MSDTKEEDQKSTTETSEKKKLSPVEKDEFGRIKRKSPSRSPDRARSRLRSPASAKRRRSNSSTSASRDRSDRERGYSVKADIEKHERELALRRASAAQGTSLEQPVRLDKTPPRSAKRPRDRPGLLPRRARPDPMMGPDPDKGGSVVYGGGTTPVAVPSGPVNVVSLILLGREQHNYAEWIQEQLRKTGFPAEIRYLDRRSLGETIGLVANNRNIAYVMIIGKENEQRQTVSFKPLVPIIKGQGRRERTTEILLDEAIRLMIEAQGQKKDRQFFPDTSGIPPLGLTRTQWNRVKSGEDAKMDPDTKQDYDGRYRGLGHDPDYRMQPDRLAPPPDRFDDRYNDRLHEFGQPGPPGRDRRPDYRQQQGAQGAQGARPPPRGPQEYWERVQQDRERARGGQRQTERWDDRRMENEPPLKLRGPPPGYEEPPPQERRGTLPAHPQPFGMTGPQTDQLVRPPQQAPNTAGQPLNHQPQGLQPQVQPQNLQPQIQPPQNLQPQIQPPQNLQPQNLQPQNLQPQNLQPQNLQPQNLQAQNLQPQNLQPQNLQPQNLQPQNLQPQNLQPQGLQPQMVPAAHSPTQVLPQQHQRLAQTFAAQPIQQNSQVLMQQPIPQVSIPNLQPIRSPLQQPRATTTQPSTNPSTPSSAEKKTPSISAIKNMLSFLESNSALIKTTSSPSSSASTIGTSRTVGQAQSGTQLMPQNVLAPVTPTPRTTIDLVSQTPTVTVDRYPLQQQWNPTDTSSVQSRSDQYRQQDMPVQQQDLRQDDTRRDRYAYL